MILEAIITTVDEKGRVNIAPIGPHVPDSSEPLTRFLLKPFSTSQTCQNLRATGEAVLHITDDVFLLAQSAIGDPDPTPPMTPAKTVRGFVLTESCRYHELRVISCDDLEPRLTMAVEVTHTERIRDFFGLNRAKHAVLEAAILATRLHLLPIEEIQEELTRLEPLVRKCGGQRDRDAFALLQRHISS